MRPALFIVLVIGWAGVVSSVPGDDSPSRRFEVVTPKDDAITAVALNERGELVGNEWREEPGAPGVIGEAPFFAQGKRQVFLPLLPTYTATFPAALSDTGLVVGRSSKPMRPRQRVPLQSQAFVWGESQGIVGLGTLPGDHASFATGISRDGRRIAGVSIGDERLRPCLWERSDRDGWVARPLPQREGVKPLVSPVVAISPDGRRVASSDSGLPTLWTLGEGETWTRAEVAPAQAIAPRAVNNDGDIAGIAYPPDGSTHAVVWTAAKGIIALPEPAGFTRSEALALNNRGEVVGMLDGPAGSPNPPRAFVYEIATGRFRILDEAGPHCAGVTAINDRGQIAGIFEKDAEPEPAPAPKPGGER